MSRKEWAAKPRGAARIACNLFALLFFLSFLPISAQLAEKSAPVHNFDGSFVKEWLVLGPFPSKDVESDFLADVGGEANVRPKEGDAVTRSDGTRLSWTRFRSQRDRVNLEEHFGIADAMKKLAGIVTQRHTAENMIN
ncbi:MAG: hypothetical protein O2960_01180 [Verrucomicrobia bacterium]|nr:hypothetical protein [Verrucomicrobiota bacterium]